MHAVRSLLIVCALLLATPAQAAPAASLDIAAVVGEEAISSADVEARIRFVIATTKLSDAPDVIARIRPQVIRALVDESLQMQTAKAMGITISDDEIAQAIESIEASRGMQRGAIANMLQEGGVPTRTYAKQIRAQLAWNKIVAKKVRPLVKVSEDEIAIASQRFATPSKVQEVQIAIITLAVDKPQREVEVKRTGEKLAGELRKGARFDEVARQFSTGSGKTDAFWIRPEQLDPTIAKALAGAAEGSITQPLRTGGGFTIVKLLKIRSAEQKNPQTQLMLKEILLKLKPTADPKETDALIAIGEEVARHPGNCQEKGLASIQDLEEFNIEVALNKTMRSSLPQGVQAIVDTLTTGDISPPFASEEGIRLYMLCDRKELENAPPDPAAVREALFRQKFELEAQKYLRNLRREAFVDIR